MMSFGVGLFIVLHEYGHALLGHLDEANLANERRRRLEHEADVFAAKAMATSGSSVQVMLAATLLLRSFALVQDVKAARPTTHPRARERLSLLQKALADREQMDLVDLWFDGVESEMKRWLATELKGKGGRAPTR